LPNLSSRRNPIERIDSLYARCLALMEKEITHLENLAVVHKLDATPAKDLRDYMRALEGMKKAHEEIVEARKAKKEARVKALSTTDLESVLSK
jgi:hypothetical protein